MTTRIIAADVFLQSATHGTVHLAAGTLEADVPRYLKDEKAPRLVAPVPAHIEVSDEPLLGDHVWAEVEE